MKKGSLHSFETKNKMKENHPSRKWNKKDYINLLNNKQISCMFIQNNVEKK